MVGYLEVRINFRAVDAQCSPNTFLEVISPFDIYKLSRGSVTANLEGVNDSEALWLKSRYFVDASTLLCRKARMQPRPFFLFYAIYYARIYPSTLHKCIR